MLHFPAEAVERPLTYEIIRKYGLVVNIFKASISPGEKGFLGIELSGDPGRIDETVSFIESQGVEVRPLGRGISRDEGICTHCGACVSVCPVSAITVSDHRVEFNPDKCIACGACVDACPFRAISSGD